MQRGDCDLLQSQFRAISISLLFKRLASARGKAGRSGGYLGGGSRGGPGGLQPKEREMTDPIIIIIGHFLPSL
jgi:hypothetical protein